MEKQPYNKGFLVVVSVITAIAILTFFSLLNIGRLINESTIIDAVSIPAGTMETHPYNQFLNIMTEGYSAKVLAIISRPEIIAGVRQEYPQAEFVKEMAPLYKGIISFLKDGNVEIFTRGYVGIKVFRAGLISFFDKAAKESDNPENKKVLENLSNWIAASYPDEIPLITLIREADIDQLGHAREALNKAHRWLIITAVLSAVIILLLFFNLRMMGRVLSIVGSAGLIISLLIFAELGHISTFIVSQLPMSIVSATATKANDFIVVLLPLLIKRFLFIFSIENIIILVIGISVIVVGKKVIRRES
jgi:hypothetical protein